MLARLRDDDGLRARMGAAAAAHIERQRASEATARGYEHAIDRDPRARPRPGSQGHGDLGQGARRRRHHRGDGRRGLRHGVRAARSRASSRAPKWPKHARTSNDRHSSAAGPPAPVARLVAALTCGSSSAASALDRSRHDRRHHRHRAHVRGAAPAARHAPARALGLSRDPREPRPQGAEGQVHGLVPGCGLVAAEPGRVPGGVLVRGRGARQPGARLPRVPALGAARVEPVLGVAALRARAR